MENKIMVQGLEANYSVVGEGRPLLILHGWGSNVERWQQVAELLAARGIQTITPDLPGFGKTQAPQSAWSLENYVQWVAEFTSKMPQLQDKYMLAGHSFGGAMAVKIALKNAQQVEKLFLISAACVRKYAAAKKVYYRLAKIVKVFAFFPGYKLVRKAVYKFIIRKSDYIYQQGFLKDTYLKVITEDLSYKVGFLKVPTILIWGTKDESTPMDQAEFLKNKIPHAILEAIEGAPHALNVKSPEALAQNIIKYV